MKKTIKTIALGVIAIMGVACASQDKQASNNNQASSGQRGGQQGGAPSFTQMLSEMDANNDGKLAKSEVKGPLVNDFSKIDADGDGFLSESELKNAPKPERNGPRN